MDLDQMLSPHFRLREFVTSYTAVRKGIDNTPPPFIVDRLKLLCERVLEPIRDHYGMVHINSGYRCLALNEAVGGVASSSHLKGEAADIEIPDVANEDLGNWIEKNLIEWDQLIYEYTDPPRAPNVQKDPHAGWIHVSYTTGHNRKMVLRK